MKPARYGPSSLDERISESGRKQCAAIERQREAVFDQMVALVEADTPRDDTPRTLKKLIDDWAQAEADDAGLKAKTQLERLLKQHHDFGEDIMDVVAENLLCE